MEQDRYKFLEHELVERDIKIEKQEMKIEKLEESIRAYRMSLIWKLWYIFASITDSLLPNNTRRRGLYNKLLSSTQKVVDTIFLSIKKVLPEKKRAKTKLDRLKKTSTNQTINTFDGTFKKESNPLVSIIIPSFNNVDYLHQCLDSIKKFTTLSYELIIIDNNSDRATKEFLSSLQNTTIQFNKKNVGFGNACNQGASKAKGEFILFLNNDTIVTKNWLSSLTYIMDKYPLAGAVGGKILDFNGLIQEAGGLVNKRGDCEILGSSKKPDHPNFSYIRIVDHCTAACLLVRKKAFNEVGGFDDRYSPAYYEDVDLNMSLRNAGYAIYYQPKSIVYHNQHTSSSIEEINSLSIRNKIRFRIKWKKELEQLYKSSENSHSQDDASLNDKKISVVIPVYNGGEYLKKCLQSIKEQTLPAYEIIVVNNNSTDDTKNIIETFSEDSKKFVYIFEARRTRGAARNAGLKIASGNIIAMTDADCIVPKNWLAKLVAPILHENESIVMGSQYSLDTSFWPTEIQNQQLKHINSFRWDKYIQFLDTKNIAFNASLIKSYAFNADQKTSEDFELLLRLDPGLKIRFLPEVKVGHRHSSTMHHWIKNTFEKGYWTGHAYSIHKEEEDLVNHPMFSFIKKKDGKDFIQTIFHQYLSGSAKTAFFNFCTGLAWRAGIYIETLKHKNDHLYLSKKFYNHTIEKLLSNTKVNPPLYNHPQVSIIIPLYNQLRYTIQCLESIVKNTTIPYEIILVDNGSSDKTPQLLRELENVTIISNEQNLGYAHANNQGAERAKANYLLFLNNDTVVQENWLQPLHTSISSDKLIGAIGPKLVYFNGRLQAAGCELKKDGWFHGIGKGKNQRLRIYNNEGETDALYGAALMVSKKAFESVNGFSTVYSPAYHEDIDLCLKIREKGYKLFYQPASVVFHKEFTSSRSEDVQTLLKENYKLLYKRWKHIINPTP